MDRVEFHHGVRQGAILTISCTLSHEGTTSVCYAVEVRDEKAGSGPIFSTRVTLVNVDDAGRKRPVRE
jgi:acyl-CoA hydrolase